MCSEETDILFYERRFFDVFNKYAADHPSMTVDPKQNLLSLCLEHLIPFALWARKDEDTSTSIHRTLMGNADLRPEVRNGLALIVIYVFSAAKKYLAGGNTDMFAILLDSENGLGIVNKTSLKIYNDPYSYFEFIKSCISGLIYAKAIPENERQNRPKKARQLIQSTGEVEHYSTLSNQLINLLRAGRHDTARVLVKQVLLLWQRNKNSVRDTRFKFAVAFMNAAMCHLTKSASSQDLLGYDTIFDDEENGDVAMMDLLSASVDFAPSACKSHSLEGGFLSEQPSKIPRTDSQSYAATGAYPPPASVATTVDAYSSRDFSSGAASSVPVAQPMVYVNDGMSHPALQIMRFERSSAISWNISVTKVYNASSLLDSNPRSSVYLVDEQMLPVEEWQGRRITCRTSNCKVALTTELEARNCLITRWSSDEHDQLLHLIADWGNAVNRSMATSSDVSATSLISVWSSGVLPIQSRLHSSGILAYEVTPMEGLVVRACPELGLVEDVWRFMYSDDFVPPQTSHVPTCGDFLSALFPQISAAVQRVLSCGVSADVTVKYASHPASSEDEVSKRNTAPTMLSAAAYQTVGSLLTPASDIIARYDCHRYVFHDVVLVPIAPPAKYI